MNVIVPATTASTTPACAARADTVLSMSAPLESLPDDLVELLELAAPSAEVGVPEVALLIPDGTTARGVLRLEELDGVTEEGVLEEAAEEPALETDTTELELELPPGK